MSAVAFKKFSKNTFMNMANMSQHVAKNKMQQFIFQTVDVSKVLQTLDVNGDGFVELDEIAHVTGLKADNNENTEEVLRGFICNELGIDFTIEFGNVHRF